MRARLLVIDDEADHACLMAMGLRLEGFEVETALNAKSALDRLAEESFDLAIVDLMMPGTNGIQLTRMIRQGHPGTRVVLTSAYPLSERQLLNADCGAVGFIPKPFQLSDLARFLKAKCAEASSPIGGAAA